MLLHEIFREKGIEFDLSKIEIFAKHQGKDTPFINTGVEPVTVPKHKGIFISFEGMDGSGKSTQALMLKDWLNGNNHSCVMTYEPGATETGWVIRKLLMEAGRDILPMTELFLFMADRSEHVAQHIKPNLAAGISVICDRFQDSTLVYQAYVLGKNFKFVEALQRKVSPDLEPDITFLLDISPEEGKARAEQRGALTYYDQKGEDYHAKVRAGYFYAAIQNSNRIRWIDGSKPIEEIHTKIKSIMKGMLNAKSPV